MEIIEVKIKVGDILKGYVDKDDVKTFCFFNDLKKNICLID